MHTCRLTDILKIYNVVNNVSLNTRKETKWIRPTFILYLSQE